MFMFDCCLFHPGCRNKEWSLGNGAGAVWSWSRPSRRATRRMSRLIRRNTITNGRHVAHCPSMNNTCPILVGCARPRMIKIEYNRDTRSPRHRTELYSDFPHAVSLSSLGRSQLERVPAFRGRSRRQSSLRGTSLLGLVSRGVVTRLVNKRFSFPRGHARHIAGPPSRGQFRRWPAASRGGASRASPSRWASPSRISGSRSPSCPESPASPAAGFAKLAAGFVSPWVAS